MKSNHICIYAKIRMNYRNLIIFMNCYNVIEINKGNTNYQMKSKLKKPNEK